MGSSPTRLRVIHEHGSGKAVRTWHTKTEDECLVTGLNVVCNRVHGGVTRRGFVVGETAPGFVGLMDHPHGMLLVLGLTGEGDQIFGLAIRGPVDLGRVRG
jgi:hypothetical protein